MIGTAAALGLSAGAGLLSGYLGSRASSQAANQQVQSAQQALAYQQQAQAGAFGNYDTALSGARSDYGVARSDQLSALDYARQGNANALAGARGDIQAGLDYGIPNQRAAAAQSVGYLQPYMNMGSNAANTLTGMYSGTGKFDSSAFDKSPDYNFRFDEGMRGLGNLQRARGGFLGGNATLDTLKYAQGAASQEFGSYFDRLMRMSGAGQQAAGQAGQNVMGTEQNIAGNVLGAYTNMANQGMAANRDMTGQTLSTYGNIANQGVGLANQNINAAGNMANMTMQGANTAGGYITGAGQAAAAGTVGAANAWSQGISNGVNNGMFLNAYSNRNAGGGGTPLGNYMSQNFGNGTGYQTNPWSSGGAMSNPNTGILNYGPGY